MENIRKSDSILVLTCGIGVQAVSTVVGKTVHPAANTVSLGGLQGLWPAEERSQVGPAGQQCQGHGGVEK